MEGQMTFEFAKRPTIKGFPELRWTGKRPYESTQYYPAQLRERYGEETNGWINKIFWGDNLQVMSHLIKEYRGKIDLIYIDPPFDSKADYKKKIEVKGVGKAETDSTSFEEKQYGDIWTISVLRNSVVCHSLVCMSMKHIICLELIWRKNFVLVEQTRPLCVIQSICLLQAPLLLLAITTQVHRMLISRCYQR